MLRFFRKYNTFILVVGGCLLMASFLVQDVVSNFANEQRDDVIGQIDGEEIRQSALIAASNEMQLMGRISPMLQVNPNMESLQWILMLKEAQMMGLSASNQEAKAIVIAAGGNDTLLAKVAKDAKVGVEQILEIVRRWAIVQQYESAILGVPYVSVVTRLTQAREIAERSASFQQQPINWRLAGLYYMSMGGRPILSEPLIQRSMYDQRSSAKITAIEFPSKRYLDTEKITSPSEADKKALFEKYKDNFEGKSEPHGFGYKTPDQVKLEYLYFSYADARDKIEADQDIMLDLEAEALTEYNKNKFRYLIPEAPAKPLIDVKPIDPKPTEKKATDDKATDKKATDKKATDKKATDKKATDKKTGDEKPATKTPETKTPETKKPEAKKPAASKPVSPKKTEGATAPACAPEDDAAVKPATPAKPDAKPVVKPDAPKTPPVVKPAVIKPAPTVPAAAPGPKFTPYEDVRKEIIDRLVQSESRKLVAKMMRQTRSIFRNNSKSLATDDDGYVVTDVDTWVPAKLEDVAEELQKEFGILPAVTKEDKNWLNKDKVNLLLNFGGATLTFQNRTLTAADYVFAMRTFNTDADTNPLLTLHPQKLMASIPLTSITGQFVFRVLDAQPAGAPAYDDVKDEVDRNARQQKAYAVLQSKIAEWEGKTKGGKLEDLAKELDLKLLQPPPFKKRESDINGQGLVVPNIRPIGKSEKLVDAVFAILEKQAVEGSIDKVPTAHRSGVVTIDKNMSAVLFRIDEYKPMTKKDYDTAAAQGSASSQALAALRNSDEAPANPLSLDAIIERIGFEYERDEDDDENEDNDEKDVASNS